MEGESSLAPLLHLIEWEIHGDGFGTWFQCALGAQDFQGWSPFLLPPLELEFLCVVEKPWEGPWVQHGGPMGWQLAVVRKVAGGRAGFLSQ